MKYAVFGVIVVLLLGFYISFGSNSNSYRGTLGGISYGYSATSGGGYWGGYNNYYGGYYSPYRSNYGGFYSAPVYRSYGYGGMMGWW